MAIAFGLNRRINITDIIVLPMELKVTRRFSIRNL